MIRLTSSPIDESAVIAAVRTKAAGAIVLFLGTTRELTGDRRTVELSYECYAKMAEKELAELEQEARRRWDLTGCCIVHRLGVVPLAETSVAIAVSAAHRRGALEAGGWLIDTLKEKVPIWKQEHYADGQTEWVHPGINR